MGSLLPTGGLGPTLDLQVYYNGLETKHWIVLRYHSTFFELKRILSWPEFANVPIKNQTLVFRGRIPPDFDTMAQHQAQNGRFRVALVITLYNHRNSLAEAKLVREERMKRGEERENLAQEEKTVRIDSLSRQPLHPEPHTTPTESFDSATPPHDLENVDYTQPIFSRGINNTRLMGLGPEMPRQHPRSSGYYFAPIELFTYADLGLSP